MAGSKANPHHRHFAPRWLKIDWLELVNQAASSLVMRSG